MLRAVKGMNDVLPDEACRFRALETAFVRVLTGAGYREIRTPLVEPTPLFVRTIGEMTDVVEKEMYSFHHHEDALTLRPEGTAGVARAFVEHRMAAKEPVSRLFYIGPMFRAERPQRGRYRQFWQAGGEIFGDPGPACDAEMIDMLVELLSGTLGVGNLEVLVSSIGGPDARVRYKDALLSHLRPYAEKLSNDSARRLETNPLRILDSKDPRDVDVVSRAPPLLDFLAPDDRAHLDGVERALSALGTPYRLEPKLVRGLDYYTRTLFEIKGASDKLGAGSTLLGGGRYDTMVGELGGPNTPAIGFAAGLERLLIASQISGQDERPEVMVLGLGTAGETLGLRVARDLRRAGRRVSTDMRSGTSLKAKMRRADALGATIALLLGDGEVERREVTMKNLRTHSQVVVALGDVVGQVAQALSGEGG